MKINLIDIALVVLLLALVGAHLFVGFNTTVGTNYDDQRKKEVAFLAKTLDDYAIRHQGLYPGNRSDSRYDNNGDWITALMRGVYITKPPQRVPFEDPSFENCEGQYTPRSLTNFVDMYNNFCYSTAGPKQNNGLSPQPTQAVVWTNLESQKNRDKCPKDLYGPDPQAYFLWSSQDEKIGIVCTPTKGVPPQGFTFEHYY